MGRACKKSRVQAKSRRKSKERGEKTHFFAAGAGAAFLTGTSSSLLSAATGFFAAGAGAGAAFFGFSSSESESTTAL